MGKKRGAAIVCGGSLASSVVTARSLGQQGVPVVCVAFDRNDPLLRTKHCVESHVITSPREDYKRFVDSLQSIAEQEHVSTLVPLNEFGIYTVVEHGNQFDGSLDLPVVDSRTLSSVQDRKRLLELAASLDIPVPEWKELSKWSQWDEPSIIKPRYSILEKNGRIQSPTVRFVDGKRPDTTEVRDAIGHEPLVQRYIVDGTEFGFFALCDDGEPVITFQHQRLRSTNYFGGASTHRKSVRIQELQRLGERILRELNWHGPAMVEFRRDKTTGEYKLMEINPRFWGSLALPVAAGIDFPYLYYQFSQGEIPEGDVSYDEGTTATYLRGELQHLGSILFDEYPDFVDRPSMTATLLSVLSSLPGTQFDMLSFEDPAPFIWDYIYSVNVVVSQLRET